jgi:hypothetical protein
VPRPVCLLFLPPWSPPTPTPPHYHHQYHHLAAYLLFAPHLLLFSSLSAAINLCCIQSRFVLIICTTPINATPTTNMHPLIHRCSSRLFTPTTNILGCTNHHKHSCMHFRPQCKTTLMITLSLVSVFVFVALFVFTFVSVCLHAPFWSNPSPPFSSCQTQS